ncbi:MAG: hypothetical protein ABEJ43_02380 [Haloferacaceae archaeon]
MPTTDGSTASKIPASVPSDRGLAYAGALLTAVVAGIHLFHPEHGLIDLFVLVVVRPVALVADPRPLAFVLSGTALFVGLSLVRNAPNRRPYYLAGVAVALTYLVGFFAWHFTGHGGFLPGREPLFHGLSPVENVVVHLVDPLAAVSKAAELALACVLALLYRRA